MNSKNRIVALILAAVMMASMLIGCKSNYSDHSEYRQKRLQWEAANPYNR